MITSCDGDDEEDDDAPLSPGALGDDPGMKVLLEVKSPDITPGGSAALSRLLCVLIAESGTSPARVVLPSVACDLFSESGFQAGNYLQVHKDVTGMM